MKKIVLATNNKFKLKEFKEMLTNYEVISLKDIEFFQDIEENGTTFLENAKIKAETVHNYLKSKNLDYIVVADDSGLCVDALDGAPGIYSARYSGVHDDGKANRALLIKNLKNKNRDAHLCCTIVVYYPDDTYKHFEGKVNGYITEEERGNTEFGYNSVFFSPELGKTFGEATDSERFKVSHRARAIEKMLKEL